jgi:hypothetical protein
MLFKICSVEPQITTWYNVFSEDCKTFVLIRREVQTNAGLSRPVKLILEKDLNWNWPETEYPDLVNNLQEAIDNIIKI